MESARTSTRPTAPTIKRLFAVSGNRCAFPKCRTPIVQGSVLTGEICHIKGRRRGGPRYNPKQTSFARHAFQNLLLLCATHHTVVDADPNVYSVAVLRKMKTGHEGRWRRLSPELNDRGATLLRGRSVHSVNQRGGITADTVNITVHQAAHPNSAISERFEALKRRVLHVGIRNNLPVELHALREFLGRVQVGKNPVAAFATGALRACRATRAAPLHPSPAPAAKSHRHRVPGARTLVRSSGRCRSQRLSACH